MNNVNIIKKINCEELIRDNTIIRLLIEHGFEIKVKLIFESFKGKSIELDFLNVQSYNIMGSVDFDRNGTLISHYKLFITNEDFVYFSFDPVDESKNIDKNDNNFIIAKFINFLAY